MSQKMKLFWSTCCFIYLACLTPSQQCKLSRSTNSFSPAPNLILVSTKIFGQFIHIIKNVKEENRCCFCLLSSRSVHRYEICLGWLTSGIVFERIRLIRTRISAQLAKIGISYHLSNLLIRKGHGFHYTYFKNHKIVI